jgi:hypothetical protein
MTTSLTTTGLSKPTTDNKISIGTLAYINARNRQRAYDLVIKEFKASGITQATLASRMGKTPDVISRLLSRPQNWESDTFSSLIFAICGGILNYHIIYPFGSVSEKHSATISENTGKIVMSFQFTMVTQNANLVIPKRSLNQVTTSTDQPLLIQSPWAKEAVNA